MPIVKIRSGSRIDLGSSSRLNVGVGFPTTLPLTGSFYDFSTRYESPSGAIPDSDKVTVSVWFKIDPIPPTPGIFNFMFNANGGRFYLSYVPAGQLLITQFSAAVVKIQDESSKVHAIWNTDLTYHHFLYSRSGTTSHLYIDDVEDSNIKSVNSAAATDFAGTINGWSFGATFNNTFPFGGCLSNVYCSPGDYFDFTIASNRRKFITAGLQPVNLGVTGDGPTGLQPAIWLPTGDPTAAFGTIASFTLKFGTAISACVI